MLNIKKFLLSIRRTPNTITSESRAYVRPVLDAFNRLIGYRNNNTTASYTYYADNLRAEKTVNGEKTDFVWNGQNLAMENTAEITNTYTYDMTGIHIANQNGTVSGYLKDMHGSVAGKTDITGAKTEDKFDYSAFGINTEDTPDPFGYCGEYYDEETGLIYLRNRYYDSTTGRFITEDPAQDGLNWYVYCGGNPVMMVDPSGLYTLKYGEFGKVYAVIDLSAGDTLYKIAQAEVGNGDDWKKMWYEGDPGALQDGEWVDITSIYNDAYPNPNKPYLGDDDYNKGVRLTTINGQWYFDVTKPINDAFWKAGVEAKNHKYHFKWFKDKVTHKADWDIKVERSWTETIGITYPGHNTSRVVVFGAVFTIKELGNIMYGYKGTAAGFSEEILIGGSVYAAGGVSGINLNEIMDWNSIRYGIKWYNGEL